MNSIRRSILPVLILVLAAASASAAAPLRGDDQALAAKIDEILNPTFKTGEPGAALLIQKDGRTLVRKGYGMADLELGIPVDPDMSFRLGSVTKQFTAVAILMLEEQGKLSVKDPIEKYLPDYPTQGKAITIENLLTHTSGIKDYTSLPEWLPLWRKDMTVSEVIALSKDKPMDFGPGEHWKYCNSGYILLGAIIEKVSGETYENFIQKHIFDPRKMTHSYYGSASRILPRRIPGYQKEGDVYINAPYLSMTQPYAAGSLLSSVDDMALWYAALAENKLIKKESLEKAWTPFKLNDGSNSGYGYGWESMTYKGHRLIEHGGGIMGFTTYAMIFPEDKMILVMLTNSAIAGRAPEPFAVKIAEAALGLKADEFKPAPLAGKDLAPLPGVYANWEKNEIAITRSGATIAFQSAGAEKRDLVPLGPRAFVLPEGPLRFVFETDAKGAVTAFSIIRRSGLADRFIRTAKPLPVERKAVTLDPKILDRYAGEFTVTPAFKLVITVENGHFLAQATGQPKFELFAESETRFFLKVVDAQVEFQLDAGGKVTGLILFQGGQKIPAQKTK